MLNNPAHGARAASFPPCVRAVLFDMDGVLFDSMPRHAASWADTATHFGLAMTRTEAYLHEGRTGESTINILFQRAHHRDATPAEAEEIYAYKCAAFNALPTAPKMPGAEAVLHSVQQGGRVIVCVTGSGQASLLERLETNYPGYFAPERIVSSHDVVHGKPHAEPYLKGLERAGLALSLPEALPASQAIVIENAPLGVQAAKAAGIYCVAVNTGPLPESVLIEAGADIVLPSMEALSVWLPQQWG